MYDFTGKFAVVTGGGQGIGEAIVRRMMAEGASGVAIIDVADGLEYANELDPAGERLFYAKCNIANRAEVTAAFEKIYEKFGRVDFLVNNAGISRDSMFHKMEDSQWDDVIGIDLGGPYNCTKQVINRMREDGFGRIVIVSSISAYGNVGQANYSAAKGGLCSMTKTLSREGMKKGITVNAVLPGAIATAMTANVPLGPLARFGEPSEVAGLICFLCSDEAAFINGALIDINGGLH